MTMVQGSDDGTCNNDDSYGDNPLDDEDNDMGGDNEDDMALV